MCWGNMKKRKGSGAFRFLLCLKSHTLLLFFPFCDKRRVLLPNLLWKITMSSQLYPKAALMMAVTMMMIAAAARWPPFFLSAG